MKHSVITIFGGTGFLGRYVVRALAGAGARLRIAARRPDEALRLKPMGDVGQITPVAANVRDPASVVQAVEGSDAVVNLVGILFERGRQGFDAVHHLGAASVARAAKAAGARRLVHVSAIGADAGSESSYARSKAAGEAAVREEFPTATVLRPSIMFGAEDEFFNRFAALARVTPVLPLIGGGLTRFQPVYVCDVAQAAAAVLDDDGTAARTFELGGPLIYSFRELMALVAAETGRRRVLVPVPVWLANFEARFLELLPVPPLTRDQVRLLGIDNVVADDSPGLSDLGIAATALEAVLPTYLDRFRRHSRVAAA